MTEAWDEPLTMAEVLAMEGVVKTFGATRADDDWAQGHPWVVLRDTSGNELCILDQLDG